MVFTSCNSSSKKEYLDELKWMTKISRIQIPNNAQNIELYNNHEWGMITKFNLDSIAFELFYNQYNLSPLKNLNIKTNLLNDIENLPLDTQFIKDINQYVYFEDCKIGNSWTVLGNLKTYEVWFEVLYPDNGGDISNCNKALNNDKNLTSDINLKKLKNTIDSLEKQNKLIEYKHLDLTIWGGLKSYSFNNKIIKIIARHNAELGYTENRYLIHNDNILEIEKVLHWAEWKKYRDKYGDKLIPEKMTYFDSIIVFNYNQKTKLDSLMIKEYDRGKDLLDFLKNK